MSNTYHWKDAGSFATQYLRDAPGSLIGKLAIYAASSAPLPVPSPTTWQGIAFDQDERGMRSASCFNWKPDSDDSGYHWNEYIDIYAETPAGRVKKRTVQKRSNPFHYRSLAADMSWDDVRLHFCVSGSSQVAVEEFIQARRRAT